MAGRFPGARSVGDLWELVRSGGTALQVRTADEAVAAGVPAYLARDPQHVNLGTALEDVEAFDASFFDIGPRDAAIMDPQHRHFLECSWEALEDAGHVPEKFDGAIGVYAGCGMNSYLLNNLLTNPDLVQSLGMFLLRHTSNDKDFLSTGVSYRLNLKGPSVNVQTACSTSLVAIHLASQALLNGECDMALAGGATIEAPQGRGYLYREGEILSPDGLCRAFDAQSKGTVLTSGAGVVVLRRLADAVADGDHIHAVIKASAINNDGAGKIGYLAPSVDGHAAVVSEALALAGVSPDSIQYVEAHGTGTAIGDPIEVAALTAAFRESTQRTGFARLGSIKPTIGHLDTAAGVASVIKTATALSEAVLPPMTSFTGPNPLIGIGATPFALSGLAEHWPRGLEPRRAGVSSLGVGGTNAHVIMEEAPPFQGGGDEWSGSQLIVLSAKSAAALDRASVRLAGFLTAHPDSSLADVAHTLQNGRAEFAHRRAVSARTTGEAAALLGGLDARRVATAKTPSTIPSVVFMFPGGGAQYPNMGSELYDQEPVYRDCIEECLAALDAELSQAVRSVMFPPVECEGPATARMALPSLQLPAIFMTEMALARLWMSWGVNPDAMTGHSLGEYAAACLAGVMSLPDALSIVSLRGQIMERSADAGMLSVALSEADLLACMPVSLSLAAVNAPELCVVSGSATAIDEFEAELTTREIPTRRIKISGAIHCSLLDPFLAEFNSRVSSVQLSAPTIPYISNVTGTWVRSEDACDPAYWVRHLRHTVRFADGLAELLGEPNRLLIEVGPGGTLTALARQQRPGPAASVSSLPHPQDNVSASEHMLLSLGRAWTAGLAVNWDLLQPKGQRRRVSLPTYPFERERHWIEPGAGALAAPEAAVATRPFSEWFSTPEWILSPLRSAPPEVAAGERALVLTDEAGTALPIVAALKKRGFSVVTATLGGPEAPFLKLNPHEYRLNPGSRQDYEQLLEQLTADGLVPTSVVHAGGILTDRERAQPRLAALSLARERAFLSLMFLLRSLGAATTGVPIRLIALTNNACRVDLDKEVYPDAAMVTGPVRVAGREYPQLSCTTLDISLAPTHRRRIARTAGAVSAEVAEQVVAELALGREDRVVALRGQRRWVQTVRECAMNTLAGVDGDGPRPGGCYLITGGFGGVASAFADDLARLGARLVLVGRTPIDAKAQRIAELEALGAEVLAISADVADLKSMSEALAQARSRFGPINGVIHAAGTLQDELLDIKDRESAEAVIRPKVVGAVVLEQVLDFASLDFAVLCSSTSAFLGPAGQADYAAANSFLDAFAQHRTAAGDRRTVSVNWGMWDGIGMTAVPSAAPVGTSITIRETGHPLLGSVVRETATETWFESLVSASTHWVLDEHRLADGTAVMPGAGYVEMVRAAAQEFSPGPVEIRNLEFHRPLIANEAQKLQVRAIRSPDRVVISICSGPVGTADSQLIERATATVVRCADALPELPVCACRSADGDTILPDQPRRAIDQHGHLRFGPRWHNVVSNNVIGGEVIAHVSLAEEFRQELELFELHPAMIDMATGLGLPLVPGYSSSNDLYIPLAYGRIRAHAPLPATFVSRVRLASCQDVHDTVSFNVDLTSEVGDPLVSIEDLVLRRVQDPASISEPANRTVGSRGSERAPSRLMVLGRAHGISSADGWQALHSALSLSSVPQIVITPVPLRTLDEACARDAASASPTTAVSRPQAMTGFEPPRDALERELAGWWSELLGIRDIGVNDDFFELGGHSLIALRLFAKIKHAHKVDLGLATLFSAPTIGSIAEILRGERVGDYSAPQEGDPARGPWPCLVPIKTSGSLPPLFCVHGAKGNVLNFREL
ncbi:MAG: SDR family NAD(P)-dependent oxidoreductase, partial [Tepidiformaceae bacterium]